MTRQDAIKTGLGDFSREKFNALVNIRAGALEGLREALKLHGYAEVTTSSLVNIAGSCENPNASFTLNYYGNEAHLSQSAQLQLEALVMRLKRGVFTVNNSFREEDYVDPEAKGRRLSEFTLVEPERPYDDCLGPQSALERIIEEQEGVIKHAMQKVVRQCYADVGLLGGNADYLERLIAAKFARITYDDALKLLNSGSGNHAFGDDMGMREERTILQAFDDIPTFVTYHPASIKFFNMKRTPDGKCAYSVDLLMPKLGETSGGAVREENGKLIKKYLVESRIGRYLSEKGQDPAIPFTEYLNLFEQEEPLLRGGYGIGFERFVGFLLGSNDILETVAYRTLHPQA
ncbi:MAG: hypothetical protein HY518_04025 [Candidatus Aenigmarchaeota archaeon]|nr:hypothetical protein [Candidatus Aenigmarchaeota archaeon]